MPTTGAVCRYEMQVVTRDIQRFRVLGSPKACESSGDIVKFELRLNGRGLDQWNSFFRPTHRSRVDVVEYSIDSQSEKEIVRRAESVEPGGQVRQIRAVGKNRLVGRKNGDCRERAQPVVPHLSHRSIGSDLKEVAVDDDHFAVQVLEST